MIAEVRNHAGRTLRQVANPVRVGGECTARQAGTPLGHHNTEILASLGYSPDEIEEFRTNGVIN